MNRVTGIYIRQVAGRLQSLATDPAHPTGSLMADFGSPAAVRNRGAISLSGEGGVIGIEGGGVFGELLIENSGAISIDNTYTEESDEVSAGIAATGYGDINIVNDAEITITANDSATSESHATTQGIFFSERSLGTEAVAALQQGGLSNVYRWVGNTLHGYDHALDMTSRVTIRTSADITASGADAHGIFGLLGWEVHDAFGAGGYVLGLPVSSNGYYGRLGNGGTSALIEVAEGATVQGGSGRGTGVGVQGVGSVTVRNDGTILGNGDPNAAAIFLGNILAEDARITTGGIMSVPETPPESTLNLVDSVNAGTIRSDAGHGILVQNGSVTNLVNSGVISGGVTVAPPAPRAGNGISPASLFQPTAIPATGYGIWVQNGAITNLVNSGLITGGIAALRASEASSVSNVAGGVIDGRVQLAAGSTMTNAGVIRASGADFVAHEIGGDLTQQSSGVLSLRSSATGRDTLAVTGDLLLDGELNLSLAAPSGSAFITVGGDLTLDGHLNVSDAGGFGAGVYRLIDYRGALTDRGMALGALPSGADGAIQTLFAGQVNLVVGGAPIQFWDGTGTSADGAIGGGSGTWNTGTTNWTRADGTVNDLWGSRFAVFQGTAGTVTIAPEGVSASGLQFASNGYRVSGGTLTLSAPATLRVGDGTQAGASMTATIDSVVAGSGGVDKTDFGTLVLTGSNTYTGGTRLSSGTLEVVSDASLGALSGGVDFRGGNLRVREGFSTSRAFDIGAVGGTFDTGSGSATYAGLLSGSGAFNRSGTGRFNFTGDGSGYTGTFGSGAGVFHLSGVLGGTLDLAAAATLSGTGRANDLRIGGRVAPGNSIGTLVADGDVTFLAGSTFEVEVAADGRSDLLQAAGTANLQGGMVDVRVLDPQVAYTDGQQYTFLSAAGGLAGTFAGVTDNSAFLDFTLGYTGTSAQLTLTRVAVFPDVALTWNQRQSSTGLRDLAQSGDALAAYNALLVLDAPSARNAFDAASGEIHAGNQQAMAAAGSAFNRALLRQPVAEGPGLWLAGVHGTGKIEGDGNAATLDHRVQGVLLGYGSGASTEAGSWTLGGAIGTTDTRADVDGRNSQARGDAWHVGVYGNWSHGPWEARAALGYMDGEADVTRGIAFGALARSARSKQAMDALDFSGELAWHLSDGKVAVAPVLTVDALRANFDATRESGAGALDLSPESQRHEQLEIGAGVRLSGALGNGGYELRAVYAQDVAADRMAERSGLFAGSPTAFTVRGPEADKERVRLSAGVSYPIATDMSLGLHYDGVFSGSGNTHGATARFDWRF